MAIKLRGEVYWLDIQVNGIRIRESLKTGDKKAAQQLHDIRRAELWRERVLKEKPRRTLGEGFDRWLKERATKRSLKDDQDKIDYLRPKLGSRIMSEVTADDIEAALPDGITASTRNRYRALVRAILNRAYRVWQWLDRVPALVFEPEPKRRVAFLTRDQATALIAALPERYRTPVRFALLTGLRRSNVFGLRWENVNLERGMVIVHADEAKAGERILVPLNAQARELLEAVPHREGLVFGEIERISPSVWKRACTVAGVPWLRFHDLRHTWASWHAMAGTPMSVLQELGGWATPAMLTKYAHLSEEHLAAAAEKVKL